MVYFAYTVFGFLSLSYTVNIYDIVKYSKKGEFRTSSFYIWLISLTYIIWYHFGY